MTPGTFFKSTHIIPLTGRYRCVVCKLVVEIPQSIIDRKSTFFACPNCHAGQEGGPKGIADDVWEYLG